MVDYKFPVMAEQICPTTGKARVDGRRAKV